MRDYSKLGGYLQRIGRSAVTLSFSQISEIVGSLPPSAYKYQAWWANQVNNHHPQTKACRDFGFRTEGLDIPGRKITFRKV